MGQFIKTEQGRETMEKNKNIIFKRKLPEPPELKKEMPLSEEGEK